MMVQFFKHLLLVCATLILSFSAQAGGPDSDIFEHEDKANATNLHVNLEGTTETGLIWKVRNLTPKEIPFVEVLLSDPEVSKTMGDGVPIKPEAVRNKIETHYLPRFKAGQPHGGHIVIGLDNQPLGYIVTREGEEPGSSEVAYAYSPLCWNQKLGMSVLTEVVETWGPTVRRIGLGQDTVHSSEKAVSAFCCFSGLALQQFEATASPKNPGSWINLDKVGFGPAQFKLDPNAQPFDYRGEKIPTQEIGGKTFMDYTPFERQLEGHFDERVPGHLEAGLRYSLVDPVGIKRTFGQSKYDGVIKYYFEKPVVLEGDIF